MSLKIDYLVNHRGHIPVLASWFKAEHPDFFARASLSDIAAEHFESRLNTDTLPISFIALMDDLPVGTVALLVESVTTHKHLSPWLGALHVHLEFRHQGIGSALVARALEKGRELGLGNLYAGVGRAVERYISEGWSLQERTIYYGEPLCILKYELRPRVEKDG